MLNKDKLETLIKEQGDVVRKLKAAKENKDKVRCSSLLHHALLHSLQLMCVELQGLNGYSPFNIKITDKQLSTLNEYLSSRSYFCSFGPTRTDQEIFKLISTSRLSLNKHPHVKRWFTHINSFTMQERADFVCADKQPLDTFVKILLDSQVKHFH